MARREAPDKKTGDFLERMFDEPAAGKSQKSRARKDAPRSVSRARLLAVLEAATEQGEEGIVLDDALLAAYLDGALGEEEQLALEGLLARSHDLRDQLAAAGEAREAVLAGKAKMPKAYIEDFDAVPAPLAGKPMRQADTASVSSLPSWLTSIMPGRRWAMAALPAVVVVIVVAVIGPGVYSPEKLEALKMPNAVVGGTLADKDAKRKLAERKSRSNDANKEKLRQTGAAGQPNRKSLDTVPGADGRRRRLLEEKSAASVLVLLDSDMRAALVELGLRQNRILSSAKSSKSKVGLKRGAAKPQALKRPAANSPARATTAPKPPAPVAEERKKRETEPSFKSEKPLQRTDLMARKRDHLGRLSALDRTISKNCPANATGCCEQRKVDAKLLRRLQAGGPPLLKMKVLRLSAKACLLTLP